MTMIFGANESWDAVPNDAKVFYPPFVFWILVIWMLKSDFQWISHVKKGGKKLVKGGKKLLHHLEQHLSFHLHQKSLSYLKNWRKWFLFKVTYEQKQKKNIFFENLKFLKIWNFHYFSSFNIAELHW